MIRSVPLLLLPLLLIPAVLHAQASGDVPESAGSLAPGDAVRTITAADVRHRIGVLAHDSLAGRDTPSVGLDRAAAWIATELSRMGLEPAGDEGGYEQRYPVRVLAADLDASSIASSTGAAVELGESALPYRWSSLGAARATGPAVLVIGSPGAGDLDGVELAGRVVVFVGPDEGVRAVVQASAAAEAGAVVLGTAESDRSWSREVERAAARTSTVVGEAATAMPILLVRDAALGDLLGLDIAELRARPVGEVRARALPGITLTADVRSRIVSEASAPNVVAVLPGSDPELGEEYVVFSAHMDHVGVGTPNAQGDSIYNGADDNASGTAIVLELAEALASLETAPRRSVAFLLVSGEEKGLWGSGWYGAHPTLPLDATVANLNADMVGRNWPDTIVAIGRHHSDLGETLARVNAEHPEIGMTAIDDLWPEQDFYRRSDHFNFARRGVPILFFFNGTHEDYHGLDDEVEAIDADKTARIGRLLFWLGLEVANREARPRWNPESRAAIVEEGGR